MINKSALFWSLCLCVFLMSFGNAWAWIDKDNGEANKNAHDAAFCITIGSKAMDKASKVFMQEGNFSHRCSELKRKWFASGLTIEHAHLIHDDTRQRRVYETKKGLWRVEFCRFKGLLRNKPECEIIPYSGKYFLQFEQ